VAKFSPIAENFTPTGPPPDVSWEDSPIPGYVDTDTSGFFTPDPPNEPYTFPSVRGAAISVRERLSNISFVEGSASEMSASIAYIRYWSRKGTQQKTAVGDTPIDGAVSDPQDALLSQINTLSYGTDLDLGAVTSTNPTRTILTTPTNTAYQGGRRQPVPTQTTEPRGPSFLNRLGSIFSANPGGAAAPPWANPFSSRAAAPSPDNAVWQFLFNPEELQLSSGPDYNRAETWGVADPANSGQPLSWRSNKNRKLTFGKVLLHGYTFGKRVDSLEKGLQELFLARDGENGADGPPVLEFVWGQRVFGPCVIQNIQVREKAWDKGLLVNAEVSFDLEQVPEWTINDEFVDVLRPGRQSTVNDPTVASEGYRDTTGGDDKPPATEPGGGGGRKPDATLSQCKNLSEDAKRWDNFKNEINKKKSGITNLSSPGLPFFNAPFQPPQLPSLSFTSTFPSLLNSYSSLAGRYSGNSFYGKNIKPSVIGDKCFKTRELRNAFNNEITIQNVDKRKVNLKYNQVILVCAKNIKSVIEKERKARNCDAVEKNDPSLTFIGPVRGST